MSVAFASDAMHVMEFAIDTFGDREKAMSWLKSPNRVMEGQKPLNLLNSVRGRETVRTILGRIEWGLYSQGAS